MPPSSPPIATPRRFVLATFGSLGDVHPYLAIALGLKARGHEATIATSEFYRAKVTALGLGFHAVRPDLHDAAEVPEFMARVMDMRRGPAYVVREIMLPRLRDSYADTLEAARGADLLVSHPLTFAVPLVAELNGIPWASTVLAPNWFFSAHDPPILAPAQVLARLRPLGPAVNGPLLRFLQGLIRSWADPVHRLRAEIGLPPGGNPLFEGQHAPGLVLALFSKLLGAWQLDWPAQARLTGFPFLDRQGDEGLPAELARFLDDGPPPIVFTLGSAAVMHAGRFYEHAIGAVRLLGRRAVLLIGHDPRNQPAGALPEGVAAFPYAPFSELFPRAAAVVHQGGVGTTAQAMRSVCPALVMPYAFDQPDNADRAARLGIARVLPRARFNAPRAARELGKLLGDPSYARRAAEVGRRMQGEDGVATACDALEECLARG